MLSEESRLYSENNNGVQRKLDAFCVFSGLILCNDERSNDTEYY